MVKEIGSEFHRLALNSGHGIELPISGPLVFSGRTAFETVLKEVRGAKKALLPSYCCDSMIEPFRRAGIEVSFYSVNYKSGLVVDIDIPEDTDIFVWCNYFGFNFPMPDLTGFKGVIIEDITHSLFSGCSYNPQSHYLVASIRKWEPINCGGYCAAVDGSIKYAPKEIPPQAFIEQKTKAMELKKEYLVDLDEKKKPEFRTMYEESNQWLADNYSEISIDPWSQKYLSAVDMEEQRRIRRRNARALYKGLNERVIFLFPEEDMDCPLFVPILLSDRDEVRRKLTEKQIYCPIHWPKPECCESNLYGQELSLICDQRYNEEDMEHLISVLRSLL